MEYKRQGGKYYCDIAGKKYIAEFKGLSELGKLKDFMDKHTDMASIARYIIEHFITSPKDVTLSDFETVRDIEKLIDLGMKAALYDMTEEEILIADKPYKKVRPQSKSEKYQSEITEYLTDKLKDYNIPYSTIYEVVECLSYKTLLITHDMANEAIKNSMKNKLPYKQ